MTKYPCPSCGQTSMTWRGASFHCETPGCFTSATFRNPSPGLEARLNNHSIGISPELFKSMVSFRQHQKL
jgi:hypothetical protein